MWKSPTPPEPPRRAQVCIIGGGIGGLSASAFLRAKGFDDVQIYERNGRSAVDETLTTGNGIHLYTHCVRMLVHAGVPIEPYVYPLDIQMRRDDGKLRADMTRDRQLKAFPALESIRASAYSLLRQNLMKALMDHTPKDTLHLEKKCMRVDDGGGTTTTVHFDDGTAVEADLVVAADGIHSVVSRQLHGERPLNRGSTTIIQGQSRYQMEEPTETWVLHRKAGTHGLVPVILTDGTAGTFWWVTIPSWDVETIAMDDLAASRHVASKYSYGPAKDCMAQVIEDASSIGRWVARDKEPLKSWYRGNVVFLGDACHAGSPFSGYGAGMTIEDGFWLAEMLETPDVLTDRSSSPRGGNGLLEERLARYQRKRASKTGKIVRDARMLSMILHRKRGPARSLLNKVWDSGVLSSVVAKKFMSVYDVGVRETRWSEEERRQGRLAY